VPPLIDTPSTVSNIIHWSDFGKFSYLDGATIVPSIKNLISVFLHGPENVDPEIRKFPAGTWIVMAWLELHALSHAWRNDWDESVSPSGLAP
jgi:hypothetical protein